MENSSKTANGSISVNECLGEGWTLAKRYARVALLYWFCGLILALLAALPMRSALLAETGDSLILDTLLSGPNYTYLNDFLQNYGSALSPILNQSLWLMVLQLLVLVFLAGGLTNLVVKRPASYDRQQFWAGSGVYFWRMLRLTLFFLLIHGLILALFAWIYLLVTKGMSPANLETEAIITSCLTWLVPLYVMVAIIPMMWQDLAKIQLVQTDARFIWPPVGRAWKLMRHHFSRLYPLALLLLLLGLLLFGFTYVFNTLLEVQSFGTIVLSFIGSQLIVILRFGLKVMSMAVWAAGSGDS